MSYGYKKSTVVAEYDPATVARTERQIQYPAWISTG